MKLKIRIDGKEFFTDDPTEVTDIVKKVHPGPISFDPTLQPNEYLWMIYDGITTERTIGHVIRME